MIPKRISTICSISKNLLGSDKTNNNDDLIDLVPYAGKDVPPEVIQAMMVKSMMPDFSFVSTDNKNLL